MNEKTWPADKPIRTAEENDARYRAEYVTDPLPPDGILYDNVLGVEPDKGTPTNRLQGALVFPGRRETSREAAESIVVQVQHLEHAVYLYLVEKPSTCDEVEEALQLTHQTASARIHGLMVRGLLEDSGLRRLTRSRRRAIVWRLAARNVVVVAKGHGAR